MCLQFNALTQRGWVDWERMALNQNSGTIHVKDGAEGRCYLWVSLLKDGAGPMTGTGQFTFRLQRAIGFGPKEIICSDIRTGADGKTVLRKQFGGSRCG